VKLVRLFDERTLLGYKMSDYLSMWIELPTDFSEEYLQDIESG